MAGIDSFAKLVLHMDTDFSDSSSNAYIPSVSNATIDSVVFKFTPGSGRFNGTNGIVTFPDSLDWQLDGGIGSDWTVDFWVNCDDVTLGGFVVSQWESGSADVWRINISNAVGFQTRQSSNIETTNFNTTLTNGVWTHVAVVFSSGTVMCFINGTKEATTAVLTNNFSNIADVLAVGGRSTGGGNDQNFKGNIDEFRISKGIARWTSNFTPPTSPYSAAAAATTGIMTTRSTFWGDL